MSYRDRNRRSGRTGSERYGSYNRGERYSEDRDDNYGGRSEWDDRYRSDDYHSSRGEKDYGYRSARRYSANRSSRRTANRGRRKKKKKFRLWFKAVLFLLVLLAAYSLIKIVRSHSRKTAKDYSGYDHYVAEAVSDTPTPTITTRPATSTPTPTQTPKTEESPTPTETAPAFTPTEASPTPTRVPVPTPTPFPANTDFSTIDTTLLTGRFIESPDIDGCVMLDQSVLGDTSKIIHLKGLTETGAVVEIVNGTTYVNGILMVNKTFRLPSWYVPKDTHAVVEGKDFAYEGVTNQVWDAFAAMRDDAKAQGLELKMSSGYRSFDCQADIFYYYVKKDGLDSADTYSARAGHSEHQSGLCFDLNSITDEFTNTAEGKWVDKNCYKYGFCIRFPKDKDIYTGYKYESWHLRYVGVELAEKLYNNGNWISLEEFFGLNSNYVYGYVTPTPGPKKTEQPADPGN